MMIKCKNTNNHQNHKEKKVNKLLIEINYNILEMRKKSKK